MNHLHLTCLIGGGKPLKLAFHISGSFPRGSSRARLGRNCAVLDSGRLAAYMEIH